jgi:proteasome lid subunit RPN8/RPN11
VSVAIPAAVVDEMLAHARLESPRECCGLLIGTGRVVSRCVRARNDHVKAATRYLINPEDHFAAIRAARAEHLEVVGAYHSHPFSAPVPSATDIAEAQGGADFLYVIVSLDGDEVRAYRIEEGSVCDWVLTVTP